MNEMGPRKRFEIQAFAQGKQPAAEQVKAKREHKTQTQFRPAVSSIAL